MRKEYYDIYKTLGICTSCGKNKARLGKVLCEECAEKDAKRVKSYNKERKATYQKRKRELCDAFGVCTTCFKNDKYIGQQCKECYDKRHRKYKEKQKEKGVVPLYERLDMDLCYICGEPVVEGSTLCEKHLNIAKNNIAKGRKKLSEMAKNSGKVKLTDAEKRAKKNAYKRRKRDLCVAFGVCPKCMQRDKYKGNSGIGKKYNGILCYDCYVKSLIATEKDKYKNGKVPRNLRKEKGLCYMCCKPVVEGEYFCEEHLAFAKHRGRLGGKASASLPTHIWRKYTREDIILSLLQKGKSVYVDSNGYAYPIYDFNVEKGYCCICGRPTLKDAHLCKFHLDEIISDIDDVEIDVNMTFADVIVQLDAKGKLIHAPKKSL